MGYLNITCSKETNNLFTPILSSSDISDKHDTLYRVNHCRNAHILLYCLLPSYVLAYAFTCEYWTSLTESKVIFLLMEGIHRLHFMSLMSSILYFVVHMILLFSITILSVSAYFLASKKFLILWNTVALLAKPIAIDNRYVWWKKHCSSSFPLVIVLSVLPFTTSDSFRLFLTKWWLKHFSSLCYIQINYSLTW